MLLLLWKGPVLTLGLDKGTPRAVLLSRGNRREIIFIEISENTRQLDGGVVHLCYFDNVMGASLDLRKEHSTRDHKVNSQPEKEQAAGEQQHPVNPQAHQPLSTCDDQ